MALKLIETEISDKCSEALDILFESFDDRYYSNRIANKMRNYIHDPVDDSVRLECILVIEDDLRKINNHAKFI